MSTQQSFSYDITRNRHKGNEQSVKANPSDSSKKLQRASVLLYIESKHTWGATSSEIEEVFGWAKNRFSGRLTELYADGVICKNGQRLGCTVDVHKKYAPEGK